MLIPLSLQLTAYALVVQTLTLPISLLTWKDLRPPTAASSGQFQPPGMQRTLGSVFAILLIRFFVEYAALLEVLVLSRFQNLAVYLS